MGKINAGYSTYCYDSRLFNRTGNRYPCNGNGTEREPEQKDGRYREEDGRRPSGTTEHCRTRQQPRISVPATSETDDDEDEDYEYSDAEKSGQEDGTEVRIVDENRLQYRAEGNANIVLSLSDNKQVLRLRKSVVDSAGRKESCVDLQRFVKYSRVISWFFYRWYVPEKRQARLMTYDLEAFNQRLTKFRPVYRLEKEIRVRDGILYQDVAFLPQRLLPVQFQNIAQDSKGNSTAPTQQQQHHTYCVEIKPKQGWSFHDEWLYDFCDSTPIPELADGDLRKCRYCLLQYLKLQKKSIEKVSKYCPLDLFSGKAIRVLHAIKGLIGAPQNNFKLLKNGNIVYDDKREKSVFNRILKEMFPRDGRTKEQRKTIFMNLIKESLLTDFSVGENNCDRRLLTIRKDRKKKDKHQLHERYCRSTDEHCLPANCALRQILDVQLLLKSSLLQVNPRLVEEPSDPYEYIDGLYEKCRDAIALHRSSWTETEHAKQLAAFYLQEEEKYQLGATALDCSIMITFSRLTGRDEESLPLAALKHIISIEGMKFLVNVTVTDLDPKSHKHYRKYVDQLVATVVAYQDFMAKLKR